MVMASLRPFILPNVTRRDLICKQGSRSRLLDHCQTLQRTLADRSRTGHIRPSCRMLGGWKGGQFRSVGELAGSHGGPTKRRWRQPHTRNDSHLIKNTTEEEGSGRGKKTEGEKKGEMGEPKREKESRTPRSRIGLFSWPEFIGKSDQRPVHWILWGGTG